MTALTIPAVANGDNEINSINANFDLVEAALNNLDGGNLNSGSVLNAALAKGKAFFSVGLTYTGAIGTANLTSLFGMVLPNVDGGSVTFKYLGASVYVHSALTVYGAGSMFSIRKNGAASSHDIELDSIAAAPGGRSDAPASPVSFASADTLTVDYTRVTSGNGTNWTLVLHFSLAHVGT